MNPPSTNQLLPCPFCGDAMVSINDLFVCHSKDTHYWCPLYGHKYELNTWNTRATPPAITPPSQTELEKDFQDVELIVRQTKFYKSIRIGESDIGPIERVLTAAKTVQQLRQVEAGIRIALQREFDTNITEDDDLLDLIGAFISHHKERELRLKQALKPAIELVVQIEQLQQQSASQVALIERFIKLVETGWQHRCSDKVGGCFAVSESYKIEVMEFANSLGFGKGKG